jgi:uncharacterized protein (DUF58 family)
MKLKRLLPVENAVSSLFTLGLFQAAAGVVLFAGLLRGSRELILMSALILTTVNTARIWAWLSTRSLDFKATVDRNRLYPEEDFNLEIRAANRKLLPVWVRVEVPSSVTLPLRPHLSAQMSTEVHSALGADGSKKGQSSPEQPDPLLHEETGLKAFQQARWRRSVRLVRRGVYRMGKLRLDAGDLLGFFLRKDRAVDPLEVLVYPRLLPLAPLPVPVRDFFGFQRAATPVEDPAYLVGTRDYHGTQPARHIHWKASARLHRLQEKLYEPTSQANVLILLDAAGFSSRSESESPVVPESPGSGTQDGDEDAAEGERVEAEAIFERTLEAVASVAVELERERVPVGLVVNGLLVGAYTAAVYPGRGDYQVSRILEMLARITSRPDPNTRNFVRQDLHVTGGTTCLYVCRRLSEEATESIQTLRHSLRVPIVILEAKPADKPAEPEGAGSKRTDQRCNPAKPECSPAKQAMATIRMDTLIAASPGGKR